MRWSLITYIKLLEVNVLTLKRQGHKDFNAIKSHSFIILPTSSPSEALSISVIGFWDYGQTVEQQLLVAVNWTQKLRFNGALSQNERDILKCSSTTAIYESYVRFCLWLLRMIVISFSLMTCKQNFPAPPKSDIWEAFWWSVFLAILSFCAMLKVTEKQLLED